MSEKKQPKQLKKSKSPAHAEPGAKSVWVGNIRNVKKGVAIAGRDIVTHINKIQRALTPGEATEKDLRLEIKQLERGVREYLEELKRQALQTRGESPYKGLESYTLSDAGEFFGREQALRELVEALKRSRMTILQAESGAGKTSLLQAGLVPRLMAKEQLAIWLRPQFADPALTLKKKFLGNLDLTPNLAGESLVNFFRRIRGIIGAQTALYLILDQFEEFFSRHTPEEDRQAFTRALAECLNDATLNVRWIISITTDAFGQLNKMEPHVRAPFANVQTLHLLDRQEAAEVIAEPARRHGLAFQKGLLERLLDDLGQGQNAPIAPTQIQLVCLALYEDLQDKDTVFTLEHYKQKGGAEGILRGYVGNVLRRDLPSSERAPAVKILEELVTSEKKRTIRLKTDLEAALASMGIPQALAESTLNHLVNRRLLRRLGEQEEAQYEIVHDYLLNEIELDEGVRGVKEASELLEQGLKNWRNHRLLLSPDTVKLIEKQKDNLKINTETAKVLFLSAVEYKQDPRPWVDLLSMEQRKDLTSQLYKEKDARKSREGLWALRDCLSPAQRAQLTVSRGSVNLLNFLWRAAAFIMITIVIIILGTLGDRLTKQFKPWALVEKYPDQCLGGRQPTNPLARIDATEDSHIVAYDPATGTLCESLDTGTQWNILSSERLNNLNVYSLSVNQKIYLLTDQGILYQRPTSEWELIEFPDGHPLKFSHLTVADDRNLIYVISQEDEIFRFDVKKKEWIKPITLETVTGDITDIAVNYQFLAVSTTAGIWYRDLTKDNEWAQFQQGLKEEPTIVALSMVRPVRTGARTLVNMGEDDWFLALTKTGDVYEGHLTELDGLNPFGSIPINQRDQIVSLTVKGYSRIATSTSGLFCEQSWTILDAEWRLYLFSLNKPCQ